MTDTNRKKLDSLNLMEVVISKNFKETFKVLKFPETILRKYQNENKNLKSNSFNKLISSQIKDIYYIAPINNRLLEDKIYWMYLDKNSSQKTLKAIKEILKIWLIDIDIEDVSSVDTMDYTEIDIEINFNDYAQNNKYMPKHLENLFLNYTARKTSEILNFNLKRSFEFCCSNYNRKAELISRDFEVVDGEYTYKNKIYNYKYVNGIKLNFKLKNNPYLNNIHLVIQPKQFRAVVGDKSFYSKNPHPYIIIDDTILGSKYSAIQGKIIKSKNNNGDYIYIWDNLFQKFMGQLSYSLPNANDVINNPKKYINYNLNGIKSILIPAGTHTSKQNIKPGLTPYDRQVICNNFRLSACKIWEGFSTIQPKVKRLKIKPVKSLKNQNCIEEVISVFYYNEKTKDKFIQFQEAVNYAICNKQIFNKVEIINDNKIKKIDSDELQTLRSSGFAKELLETFSNLNKKIKFNFVKCNISYYNLINNNTNLTIELQNFKENLSAIIETINFNKHTIIELENAEYFNHNSLYDTKESIRKSFLKSGILAQFIQPFERKIIPKEKKFNAGKTVEISGYFNNIGNSVLDIFMRKGYLKKDIEKLTGKTSAVAGIYLHKNFNLFILTLIYRNKPYMTSNIFSDWYELEEGFSKLNEYNKNKIKDLKLNRDYIYRTLNIIKSELNIEHIILMGDIVNLSARNTSSKKLASLLDYSLTYFGLNNKFDLSLYSNWDIPTEENDTDINTFLTEDYFSFAFYNTEVSGLCPEWTPLNNNEEEMFNSLIQGYFGYENIEGIYYSIGNKPSSLSKMSYKQGIEISRFEEENMRKDARKETAIEIYVPQANDKTEIGRILHSLRKCNIQYSDFTTHPLPVHIAKKCSDFLFSEK